MLLAQIIRIHDILELFDMFSRSKGGVRVPQKRRHTRLVRGGLAVSVVVYLVVAAWIGHTHTLHDFQILRQVVNVAKRPPAHGDTYKFYDYGSVYHDMNFTCPVAWVRIDVQYIPCETLQCLILSYLVGVD